MQVRSWPAWKCVSLYRGTHIQAHQPPSLEQVRDVEDETRQHALLSATQNGRINVAHARKVRVRRR